MSPVREKWNATRRRKRRKGRRCGECRCLIEHLHALRARCDPCQLAWRAARLRALRKRRPEIFRGYELARKPARRRQERERYRTDPVYRRKKIDRACRRRSEKVRALILLIGERDGWVCGRPGGVKGCGTLLTPEALHVDHILPRSRGGTDEADNLQLLCATCNMKWGNRKEDEWDGPA